MNTAKCVEPTTFSGGTVSRFSRNLPKALELFAERGFAQVSLRELANHLEISPGSIYNHCSSKDELLLDFIEEHYLALLSLFNHRKQRKKSPKDILQAIVLGVDSLYETHPLHFRLATRDVGCLKPKQQLYIEQLRQQFGQQLNALLCAAGLSAPGHANIPAVELLEHLPIWLAGHSLDRPQRCAMLMRLLTAPAHTPFPPR
ncbi:TetR/AcrR family transcriptional regulator [Pseudomonas chengduensis]|uniref:TetR/AcrR family transcriptional regulator n=1 Tax=Pseudomonas sediminis TaxID=1691904 RepID=UPI00244D0B94|nr:MULTISPECIES: TetR/AcrR family transcriptional regulator [Pseudomonas]MDG9757903.1 TetR/AcrR family transcriptional regulator [Pseudomonas sediminis]MDH0624847.1 TetR/AcrR family transcriptional regulator [Pseudomonas chengduensis]MDH1664614.1 TetR/AcrR family transcriptional regulator [Pseudomonas chengduensis]